MNEKPTHLDLFSGIGGFSIAAEKHGFKTIGFSEINPYSSKILKNHWPTIQNFGDIRNITKGGKFSGLIESVDLITGGFPCQPFSNAGERRGDSDERFLWPELLRVISEIRPRFAILENVPGLLTIDGGRTFNRILSDICSIGYDCIWNLVPACAIGANHERDRLWIVLSNSNSIRWYANNIQERKYPKISSEWAFKLFSLPLQLQSSSRDIRGNDGLSDELDEDRVKALGNSIVPQVAEIFIKEIRNLL